MLASCASWPRLRALWKDSNPPGSPLAAPTAAAPMEAKTVALGLPRKQQRRLGRAVQRRSATGARGTSGWRKECAAAKAGTVRRVRGRRRSPTSRAAEQRRGFACAEWGVIASSLCQRQRAAAEAGVAAAVAAAAGGRGGRAAAAAVGIGGVRTRGLSLGAGGSVGAAAAAHRHHRCHCHPCCRRRAGDGAGLRVGSVDDAVEGRPNWASSLRVGDAVRTRWAHQWPQSERGADG